jgi:hypothetical protein
VCVFQLHRVLRKQENKHPEQRLRSSFTYRSSAMMAFESSVARPRSFYRTDRRLLYGLFQENFNWRETLKNEANHEVGGKEE